jgi:hypothetical protein
MIYWVQGFIKLTFSSDYQAKRRENQSIFLQVIRGISQFLDKKIRAKKDGRILPQAHFSTLFAESGQIEICSEDWFDLASDKIKDKVIQLDALIEDIQFLTN